MIHQSLSELIGHTPLLRLKEFEQLCNAKAEIVAKLESFNPAGSAKDRVALSMLNDAEQSGRLKRGDTVIEPTSGNTGIGLASVAAARGYKVVLTMPDTMSKERIGLLKAYGAEIVLTPGAEGMNGAVKKARELSEEAGGAFIAGQFDNPANPAAHYNTTGPEIWADTEGAVDIFVAGVGTGGTLSGTGRYLKEMNPDIKVVAVEPSGSPLLTENRAGAHKLQGIGANFISKNLDRDIVDEVMDITDEEAYAATRETAKREGILVGISAGAALAAAAKLASMDDNAGKRIVVILPDTGDRYLSTGVFD